jgi:thiol-disulfide isomerase/thioredoxin
MTSPLVRLRSIPPLVLLSFAVGCTSVERSPEPEGEADLFYRASPRPVPETEVETLAIGAKAPDFRLPGVDGRFHSLSDFDHAEALVVLFTTNHCPTAQAYEERVMALVADYRDRGMALIAISPTSPPALLHEECGYSDLADSFEDMRLRAEAMRFNFPYVYDGDNQAVSIRYGPVATPHAFLFDRERSLRYVGRLDGSEKPGTANAEDLRAALDAVLEGRPVAEPVTRAFGCSIKWGWKTEWRERVDREWREAPVELEGLDEDGVRRLLANDSDKLRLINVWATWCGPCVIEYPELIVIHRMYKGRDFEFVSLSADSPDQHEGALKFLRERNSAVKNHIFSRDDRYALMELVDPNWNGALPYTVLVEPGGAIVYRKEGAIDPLELKRAIVDHPMIGRYY